MDIGSDVHDCECWEWLGREGGPAGETEAGEIDGLQAEQFLPCGQKLHKSRNYKSRMRREAGPCPDKRWKTTTFLILKVKETTLTPCTQKGPLEVEEGEGVIS